MPFAVEPVERVGVGVADARRHDLDQHFAGLRALRGRARRSRAASWLRRRRRRGSSSDRLQCRRGAYASRKRLIQAADARHCRSARRAKRSPHPDQARRSWRFSISALAKAGENSGMELEGDGGPVGPGEARIRCESGLRSQLRVRRLDHDLVLVRGGCGDARHRRPSTLVPDASDSDADPRPSPWPISRHDRRAPRP